MAVFNPGTRTGPQALKNRMNTVMELTRLVWSGSYHLADGGSGFEERDGLLRRRHPPPSPPSTSRPAAPGRGAARTTTGMGSAGLELAIASHEGVTA